MLAIAIIVILETLTLYNSGEFKKKKKKGKEEKDASLKKRQGFKCGPQKPSSADIWNAWVWKET